jgi:DNA-3-methyladenine glycosylase
MEKYKGKNIGRNFYLENTENVAKKLLGKAIVTKKEGICAGIIIETEAYFGLGDPASHAYNGMTPRSRLMFGKPGIAYVYLCYGMYYLFNIVTGREGSPGAVLIRSLFPVYGIDIMKKRRNSKSIKNLSDGPGKLTIAMGIGKDDNGKDVTNLKNDLFILDLGIIIYNEDIESAKRIGIKQGKDKLLRFYLKLEKVEKLNEFNFVY